MEKPLSEKEEFSPKIQSRLHRIITNIFKPGTLETGAKKPTPDNEDDLRPISLAVFFSKVTEQVVVMWLMHYIGDKMDFRQNGGTKWSSLCHYIIELINSILLNQDCLLVIKLSDMGVPGWLLKVVMGFLTKRRMIIRKR